MGIFIFTALVLGGIGCMIVGAYLCHAFTHKILPRRRQENLYLLPERRER
jgi:hypothetical protein